MCFEIDALADVQWTCRVFLLCAGVIARMIFEHSHKVIEPRGRDNFQKTLILMQLVTGLSSE